MSGFRMDKALRLSGAEMAARHERWYRRWLAEAVEHQLLNMPAPLAAVETLSRGDELLARFVGPRPARDVAPGTSWAFTHHRSQAEVA